MKILSRTSYCLILLKILMKVFNTFQTTNLLVLRLFSLARRLVNLLLSFRVFSARKLLNLPSFWVFSAARKLVNLLLLRDLSSARRLTDFPLRVLVWFLIPPFARELLLFGLAASEISASLWVKALMRPREGATTEPQLRGWPPG